MSYHMIYYDVIKLVSGCPVICLQNLRANTKYVGCSSEQEDIRWLWEVEYVKTMYHNVSYCTLYTFFSTLYINLYYNTTIFLNYVYKLHIFFILSSICSYSGKGQSITAQVLERSSGRCRAVFNIITVLCCETKSWAIFRSILTALLSSSVFSS